MEAGVVSRGEEKRVVNSESQDRVRAHLWIEGLVQGVGFRAFVQSQAVRRGLRGWVRNLPDGRVESEVEGAQAAVSEFIQTANKGPSLAHVQNVEVEWMDPNAQDSSFEIVY